jgi:hypothetical protein
MSSGACCCCCVWSGCVGGGGVVFGVVVVVLVVVALCLEWLWLCGGEDGAWMCVQRTNDGSSHSYGTVDVFEVR